MKEKLLFFIFGVLPHLITIALVVYKFMDWTGIQLAAGIIIMVIYFGWIIIESKIMTVDDSKLGTSDQDKHTFEFYFFTKWITIYSALIIPIIWKSFNVYMIIGIILFAMGAGLRLWAITVLGRYYSHHVRLKDEHKIISSGPYNIVRHPSYTGMCIAQLGFIIFFFNWISLGCLLVLFYPAIVARILIEEKVLMQVEQYKEYSESRKRLIPFIW